MTQHRKASKRRHYIKRSEPRKGRSGKNFKLYILIRFEYSFDNYCK
jgi:hypothetical protein